MATYLYSSSNVMVIYGGKLIDGKADGDFLKVTFAEDYISRTMGTDGQGALSVSFNESADVELTLLANSPYNDYMSAIFQNQRNGIIGLPFLCRDAGGTSLFSAEVMYIAKMPDRSFSRDISSVVWSLGTTNMTAFIGSNRVLG